MNILSNTFIIAFVAIGIISGFFIIFLSLAYYKIHRADKLTRELSRNRWDNYIHGTLNFNRHQGV